MKYFSIFKILIIVFIIQSCNTTKNTSVFWVSGQKTECFSGVGKTKCLNIHKGKDLNNPNWENFYTQIEGFSFEEGLLQKIEVKVEKLDPENVPADASSIKYTLIKVLEKQQDYQSLLDGSWTLQQINGNTINQEAPLPSLSIDLSGKQISGTDGCNNYMAEIADARSPNIKLGNIASTKKMCRDMPVANAYNKALNNVATYQIKSKNLFFYDTEGNEILSFIKAPSSAAHQNLHDIWNAVRINGGPIHKMAARPRMEINLTKMKVVGSDGCNDYYGEIKGVTAKSLSFENIGSTLMLCSKMDVADSFNAALTKVRRYEIDGLNLKLFDEDGNEILAFLKGD